MEFSNSIQGFFSLFVDFHEVFMIFGDSKEARELITYRVTCLEPSHDTFLIKPYVGITVFYKLLSDITLSLMGPAPNHDHCVLVFNLFWESVHMAGMNMIGVRNMKCIELGMGAGVDQISFLFPGDNLII